MRLRHKSTTNRLSNFFKSDSKKSEGGPAIPPLPPAAHGDLPRARIKNQLATKEELRDLRELIRYRYALDVEIWNLRDVQEYNREVVREKMKKSTAALHKIRRIVDSLDNRSYFSSDVEHEKLKQIKSRILLAGKRDWDRHPPWEDDYQRAPLPVLYEYNNFASPYTTAKPPQELDSDSGHGMISYATAYTSPRG